MMPINYQVGDVVRPKNKKFIWEAKVIDIVENGAYFIMLHNGATVFIKNHELSLFEKSKVGTLLYGNKNT
jgi:hypothetical protein